MPLQAHDLPTVVMVNNTSAWEKDVSTNVIYNTTASGVEKVFIDFSLYNIGFSDLIDTLLELEVVDLEPSFIDIIDEVRINLLSYIEYDVLVTLLLALKNETADDLEVEWFLSYPLQKALNDTEVSFRINIGTIPAYYDVDVNVDISGAKYYNCSSDIYCSKLDDSSVLDVDIEQGIGRLTRLETDLYSSKLNIGKLGTDLYSSKLCTDEITTELTTISGRITSEETDIFSCVLNTTGATEVDFKTRSLFTGDFFIESDTFTTASSIAWVDVIDYLYPINTDNTYLYVDGILASGIYFESVPNGQRIYYDPTNDFYSDGVLTYSVYAENTIGEVEEKDFYLLYGYDLHVDEVIDWGPNSRVLVRAEAQNLMFCSSHGSCAFDFTTTDLSSINLKCTIVPVGFVDLAAQIFPQSTTFFYGKTYTVRLQDVKDFQGNIMSDLEYTFTIEDPLI